MCSESPGSCPLKPAGPVISASFLQNAIEFQSQSEGDGLESLIPRGLAFLSRVLFHQPTGPLMPPYYPPN